MKDSQYLSVKINFKKPYKNKKILKINDNLDRDEAKLFTNHELYLERSVLKQTNLDEYYHVDLIGLKVYDLNNNLIGVIDEIISNNNLDYLNVNLNNNFLTIPFTKKKLTKLILDPKNLLILNSIMIFNTISINPEFIKSYFQFGINAKAMRKEIFKINFWNPLNFCKKKRLDDSPYGGGRV